MQNAIPARDDGAPLNRSVSTPLRRTKPSPKIYVVVGAINALLVIGGLIAYYLHSASGRPVRVVQISRWNKPMNGAVISPDGYTVAFSSPVAGFGQVFVMLASGGEPLQLTNDPWEKTVDSFSPDGTQIYYSSNISGSESHSVPTLGGASTVVTSGSGVIPSPDGNYLYFIKQRNGSAVFRKPRSGLGEEMIFRAAEGTTPVQILPFPNGNEVLLTAGNDMILGSSGITLYRVNVATRDSQKIGELSGSPTGLVWNDPGKTLLCSRTVEDITNIWEYRLADGNLRQVTFGAGPDLSPMPTRSGKGIYFVNGKRAGALAVHSTRTKQSRDLVNEEATQPNISWDARRIAYITLSGNAQQGDIWVSDIDGNNPIKLTSGLGLTTVAFSSDASKFMFADREGGVQKIYIINTDGTGLRQVPWSGAYGGFGAPSPDPHFFYLGGQETDLTKFTIWKVPADGSKIEKLGDNCGAVWDASPDGKYLLTSLNNGAQMTGISEFDLSTGKCISLLPDLRALVVHFASDGKAILYIVASRGESTIYRQPWHDGKLAGPAQAAVKLPFAFRQAYSGNAYEFSKDLSMVAYTRPGGNADLYLQSQR